MLSYNGMDYAPHHTSLLGGWEGAEVGRFPWGGGPSWVPTDGRDRGSAPFTLYSPERQMDSEGAVREGWRP